LSKNTRIVIATHNKHKVAEICAILNIPGCEFICLDDLGITEAPEEDASTFLGNARIKARFAHQKTGLPSLADDSGLEVDALDGAPGVFSARYAGVQASDVDNNAKLLEELGDLPAEMRTARFICAVVLIDQEGNEMVAVGSTAGRIGFEPRGSNGFGYDPLFLVKSYDYERTMAQLDASVKNTLSHRFKALSILREGLALELSKASSGTLPAAPNATDVETSTEPVSGSHAGCSHGGSIGSPTKKPVEIVVFDFDGTLIDASSPVKLISRLNRDRIMTRRSVGLSLVWGVKYKLGLRRDQIKPRRYVFASFKDFHASDANAIMKNLYHEELRNCLRPEALAALEEHRAQERHIVVVSASFEPIIRELCADLDIEDFLCTRMEISDGSYTGETLGMPPEGIEKLTQLTQWANDKFGVDGWIVTHAYGDHHSDVHVMETAQHPIAIDPDRKLERVAKKRGWQTPKW